MFKSANNDKVSSDTAALRIAHEVMTKFVFLSCFVKESIEHLPNVCKNKIHAIEVDLANFLQALGRFSMLFLTK